MDDTLTPGMPEMPEVPLAFEFCYEWKTPFGLHRKFSPSAYNGSKYHNAFTLYTKEQLVEFARIHGLACFNAGRAEGGKDAWISVEDRLPELGPDEEGVQVWTWDGEFIEHDEFVACYEQPAGPAVGGWMRVGDWFASDTASAVTHWRPYFKPTPPAAMTNKDEGEALRAWSRARGKAGLCTCSNCRSKETK